MIIQRRREMLQTPNGMTYPILTVFKTDDRPFCKNCNKLINNGEVCYFCRNTLSFFC